MGVQCELVWDFSQIKVDALWIDQSTELYLTMSIYTFVVL